jgi:YjbE family integral membrane protein
MFDLGLQVAVEPMSMSWLWDHIVSDFANIGSPTALTAFATVVLLDIALAGDNAIIVGALAAGLPTDQRKKVIAIGILAALILRIVFAVAVLYGLESFKEYGLVFGGGLLLLWVAWKMYRELRPAGGADHKVGTADDETSGIRPPKSFAAAAWAVAVADVSMSLDNVLAVAGAAREHPGIMVIGLILSVALMGRRRQCDRALHRTLSLDRVDRPRHHRLRRRQDDPRGLARPPADAGRLTGARIPATVNTP